MSKHRTKIDTKLFRSKENLSVPPLELIDKKNRIMREIRGEEKFPDVNQKTEESEKESRKYSRNYFRKSMLKCIQTFVDKNESNELMEQLKNDKDRIFGKKKHFDYIPVCMGLFRFTKWSTRASRLSKKCSNIGSM
jgi:hypothetical protein